MALQLLLARLHLGSLAAKKTAATDHLPTGCERPMYLLTNLGNRICFIVIGLNSAYPPLLEHQLVLHRLSIHMRLGHDSCRTMLRSATRRGTAVRSAMLPHAVRCA